MTFWTVLLKCLFPSDHRYAAGWFLAISLVHLALGSLLGAVLRLNLLSPTGAFLDIDQYNHLFPPHGLISVHLAVVPLLSAVAGVSLVPASIGANRVALPWLLPPNCYLHLLSLIPPIGGLFHPLWPVWGVILVYLSLALVSLNLWATLLFCREPNTSREGVPVFAWIVCLSAVSVNMAFLLSLESLWAIAAASVGWGACPPLPNGLTWDVWPPLGQLPTLLVTLPAAALLVDVALSGSYNPNRTPANTLAGWLAVMVLAAVWLGNTVGSVAPTFSDGRPSEFVRVGVQTVVPFLGMTLVGVVFAVALVVVAIRGTFRDAPVGILAVAGMLAGFAGLLTPVLGAVREIQIQDTHVIPAGLHATAAAIAFALLAALLKGWRSLTGRDYFRTHTAIGCVLFALGVAGAVGAQAAVGWLGMPRKYPNYPDEFQPLNVTAGVGACMALLGVVWLMVMLAISLLFGRRVESVPGNTSAHG